MNAKMNINRVIGRTYVYMMMILPIVRSLIIKHSRIDTQFHRYLE